MASKEEQKGNDRGVRLKNPFAPKKRAGEEERKENLLREINNERALGLCKDTLKAFADCAKEKGLMVVVACRKQNTAMNKCLQSYTNEDAFQEWKKSRGE